MPEPDAPAVLGVDGATAAGWLVVAGGLAVAGGADVDVGVCGATGAGTVVVAGGGDAGADDAGADEAGGEPDGGTDAVPPPAPSSGASAVSYTHLTLPTKRI